MSLLEHVIVGLLCERPMHGYELKRALSPALSRDRQVNDGVLYPLLARLVSQKRISKRVIAAADGRPDRHVFSPTRSGERWFQAWLDDDAGEDDEVTYDFIMGHPFLAKAMFFSHLSPAQIRRKLGAQRRSARAKLQQFGAIRAAMVERGADADRVAILDLGIAQQKAKIRWIDRRLTTKEKHR